MPFPDRVRWLLELDACSILKLSIEHLVRKDLVERSKPDPFLEDFQI